MKAPLLRHFLSLGPVGNWPVSGMWGSLAGWVLAWILPSTWLPAGFCIASLAGISLCRYAVNFSKDDDPAWFIWDEVCGMMLAVIWLPKDLFSYFIAYLYFRLFDAAKIWPVNWVEKKSGTFSIMWDDLAAGVMAGAATSITLQLFFY